MKKTNILIMCTLLSSLATYGNEECMAFGAACQGDHDYHTLHYVGNCYCPCKDYKRLPREQCSYCGHYRYPTKLVIREDKKQKKATHHRKKGKIPANVIDPKLYKVFGESNQLNPQLD